MHISATETEALSRLHTLEDIASRWSEYEGKLDDISAWVHHTKEQTDTGPGKATLQDQLQSQQVGQKHRQSKPHFYHLIWYISFQLAKQGAVGWLVHFMVFAGCFIGD